jgi:hypothetical protein
MSKSANKRSEHNAYMREKIECECGVLISRVNMVRHTHTESHIKIVDQDQYIKIIEAKYDKKIKKLEREKKRELKKIDKEIEEAKSGDV